MTINEVITYIDEFHPNSVSFDMKIRWINETEAYIQREIMLMPDLLKWYDDEDGETELIAPAPYDEIYVAYLDAKLFYMYHEITQYENASARYNYIKEDFAGWYAETVSPTGVRPSNVYLGTGGTGGIPEELPISAITGLQAELDSKQDEIDADNKLSYNLLSDTPSIPTETTVRNWGFTKNTGTYSKPSGGIPKTDLDANVQESLNKADDAVQLDDLANVATSGSYSDLFDTPTIPDEVTEETVSTWGFTKNTGTYSKPSDGIPESDLSNEVKEKLNSGFGGTATVYMQVSDGYIQYSTDGTTWTDIIAISELKGADGQDGAPGTNGTNGADGNGISSAILNANYTLTLTFTDGTTYTTPSIRGADGADGTDGQDGYTPVKGTDYWTAADQSSIVQDVLAALPTWTGGSY